MGEIGKVLLLFGLVMVAAGLALMFLPRIPWLGRLPGDLSFQWGNTRVYVPLATSILVSILLTLVLNLLLRR